MSKQRSQTETPPNDALASGSPQSRHTTDRRIRLGCGTKQAAATFPHRRLAAKGGWTHKSTASVVCALAEEVTFDRHAR